MTKKLSPIAFKYGFVDDIIRAKNIIKTIHKKYRYDFTAFSPNDMEIGRYTIYADNIDEAKKKMYKEIKNYMGK